jgi:hypothetical protein
VAEPDGSVNYTVKELLARVDLKIDGLYDKLDTKADQADLDVVKTEVEGLKADRYKAYGAIVMIGFLAGAGLFHPF